MTTFQIIGIFLYIGVLFFSSFLNEEHNEIRFRCSDLVERLNQKEHEIKQLKEGKNDNNND